MPPDRERADAPKSWLENARSDLAIARIPLPPGGRYEHLCFHIQQAVEKSLKAVLLSSGVDFPFTHNLQALIDLFPSTMKLPPVVRQSVVLNPYAVVTRYPGESEPVTEEEYRDALRIAETVLLWSESAIKSSN
jgi:HEPN domain-containing protein